MSQRFEGRNLEEALQAASQGLGVDRWQMTYHVVLEKRGFLGGMKRVVIEADVNAEAPPPPQPLQPLPRVETVAAPVSESEEAPAPRNPRTERQPRGSNSGIGEPGGGRERGARPAGGGRDGGHRDGGGRADGSRAGGGRGAGGRGGAARGGAGRGGNGRGRRGGGGGPRRETRDDLQVGDFEQFLTADVPEQGSESDQAKLVHGWVDEVLSLSRLDVVARTEENETQIIVRLYGRDTARLTDRHGEVLDAIQVLANKALVGRKVEKEIELDAGSFKDKRMEELGQQARAAADRVRREGREELLPAMSPIERRIVHLTLRDDADVTTESRGEGFFKRVAIILRSEAAPPAEPES